MNHHKRDFSVNDRLLRICGLAALIGGISTLAAVVLLGLIHLFTNLFFFGAFSFDDRSPALNTLGPWVIGIPVIGGLIVGLMARFGSEKIRGHGIPEAIEAILFGKSRMSPKVAVLKPLSSGIVIGSGGPFGAEGPIIMTGGALGSLLAQCIDVTAAERKTLLVAGAAAGMTAVFGTPVAAVLLAVELLLFEWRPRSFLPVALACAVAGFARAFVFGTGALFPLQTQPAHMISLLSCLVAGLLSGALASGLSAALYKLEDAFGKLPLHWMWWPAIGGLVVGIGGFIEPRALGVGYDVIGDLLHQHIAVQAAVAILTVKAVIWVVALASGTSGGVLAPLLIIGGALGAIAGHWLPGGAGTWALLGMASVMSAAMRAPLTAAIFAIELTGRFELLPAAAASAAAGYAVGVLLLKRSILTEKISRRGRHILQEYTIDPLALAQAGQIMTENPQTLPEDMLVVDAILFFERKARHRSYPVVDAQGRPVGLASRSDALRWGNGDLPPDETLREQLSDSSLPVVYPNSPAVEVANLMIAEDIGRVCVVSREDGRVIGIIARRNLLQARANKVREEEVRLRPGSGTTDQVRGEGKP